MNTADFFYDLPKELIAQTPVFPRDSSRLLVVKRNSAGLEHRRFFDLPQYLRPGDALVLNRTKVLPARLIGRRESGGEAEILLLKRIDERRWETLARPGRRLQVGAKVAFGDGLLSCSIEQTLPDGGRIVHFEYEGVFEEHLHRLGAMPLPPYITQRLSDPTRYQTVYCREEGSAAAPTAGLHFTPELLARIEGMGISVITLLLHVGLGTFRPVAVRNVEEHKMHSERYELSHEAAEALNRTRAGGGRIICVGTTTVRTLETCADEAGVLHPAVGETDIFITPGYRFKAVDALITNFHLPESTLLMLVSAFSGREKTLAAYAEAVREGYRFFSFGDAMLLL